MPSHICDGCSKDFNRSYKTNFVQTPCQAAELKTREHLDGANRTIMRLTYERDTAEAKLKEAQQLARDIKAAWAKDDRMRKDCADLSKKQRGRR